MKSDRQTYKADHLPAYERDVGLAVGIGEPMSSYPLKSHPARLIEYNKWMRHEERRYSHLLTELKKASWFIQFNPPKGDPSSGFAEFDIGETLDGKCDVGQLLDKLVLSELETTRLTQDEIRNGCWLTMEQELLRHNRPPLLDSDKCLERTSTQQSITFQYTVSVRGLNISRSPIIEVIQAAQGNLSESSGNESLSVNRLWLEVSETYSNYSEYDSTAAINAAILKANRRIENWYPGSRRHQSVLPLPWNSIMVESVRFVLQRWRGICSFSQTMRGNQAVENY